MYKSIFLYVFVAYSMVPKDKHNHCFSVSNKDFDGRFDSSSLALTKRSQTLSNGTCVSRILSDSV